ncbi:MAG: bifunctional glutamate N-acetyltransferase/amino-acid acetyltransferase ArgJ [Dehalococcoidales bacterium]|nr:bifunctional glutamate N-acetyltransferase/amino-acid acetyltransferase ArgJ [Dehalococcoidales bacterium]
METAPKLIPGGTVTSAKGFRAGGICAGIKKNARNNLDLGIILSEVACVTAGVFTSNKMKSAPVILCRERLPSKTIRALVVNSGCANAGTGEQGMSNALAMIASAAERVGVTAEEVLVASTGLIGKQLPIDSRVSALREIKLSPDGGHTMAEAILTTDTTTKEVAARAGGFTIGGIAKGSGMVHPQLGTLLCFLTTDASVDMDFLVPALRQAVDISFNMVSIDGDTSPNDTMLLMANGLAGNEVITRQSKQAALFQQVLDKVCTHLAKAIASDGEGASKLIEATVSGAASTSDARAAARTIIGSPLVKAAIHGNNPNWGRIIAAAGRSGAELVESRLDLHIGGICLIKGGSLSTFDRDKVVQALANSQVAIDLNLNLGEARATAWGCDLSPEYVTINSEHTT